MKHKLTALLALYLCLPVTGAEKAKPLPKNIPSLTELAEKGDANAQNALGVRHYSGQGVMKNFNEALQWFTKAAAQGHVDVPNYLGMMYDAGEGVPEDDVRAYACKGKQMETN